MFQASQAPLTILRCGEPCWAAGGSQLWWSQLGSGTRHRKCRAAPPGGPRVDAAAGRRAGEYRYRQTAPHGRHGPTMLPYNLPHPLMPATHAGRTFKERAQVATVRPPVALQSQDEGMWWWRGLAQFPGWLWCHLPACSLLQRHLAESSIMLPATVLLLQPLATKATKSKFHVNISSVVKRGVMSLSWQWLLSRNGNKSLIKCRLTDIYKRVMSMITFIIKCMLCFHVRGLPKKK